MAMEERQLHLPEQFRFDPVITYKDPARHPRLIGTQTNINLDLYFNLGTDVEKIRDYLSGFTQPYLQAALRGFKPFFETHRAKWKHDDTLDAIAKDTRLPKGDPSKEDREAFGHALVVFSHMPNLVTSRMWFSALNNNYSRRMALRPPQTTSEILNRLNDLRWQVHKVIIGDTPQSMKALSKDTQMQRALLYFQSASELKKVNPSPSDVELAEQEAWERLTHGVNMYDA